jgi:hypothetical protein
VLADQAGPTGPLASSFEDGLRFLATALALASDSRSAAAAVSAACDAIACFLRILGAAAEARLPDPGQDLARLRAQCTALLTPRQGSEEAAAHAIEAARLARDQAARLLPRLL